MIPENRVCNGSFPIPKLLIRMEDMKLFGSFVKKLDIGHTVCRSSLKAVR